jgi:hypothetical protein
LRGRRIGVTAIAPLAALAKLPIVKQSLSAILIVLLMATCAFGQSIATSSGPSQSPEVKKAIEQFNTDVAAWNKRCKVTKTPAEDAWCKKERARIDAKRAELVALGAIPR